MIKKPFIIIGGLIAIFYALAVLRVMFTSGGYDYPGGMVNLLTFQCTSLSTGDDYDCDTRPCIRYQPLDLAEWKVYKNDDYHFEVQIPPTGYAISMKDNRLRIASDGSRDSKWNFVEFETAQSSLSEAKAEFFDPNHLDVLTEIRSGMTVVSDDYYRDNYYGVPVKTHIFFPDDTMTEPDKKYSVLRVYSHEDAPSPMPGSHQNGHCEGSETLPDFIINSLLLDADYYGLQLEDTSSPWHSRVIFKKADLYGSGVNRLPQ